MIRVRLGLLIPVLLLAGLVFGAGRCGYAATYGSRPVFVTAGQGHVDPAGLTVYTDWDDHHHPGDRDDWDHDHHHHWGDRDWDHGYRGWQGYRWHYHYRDHDEHHYWGGDDDDHDRGQWYRYGRYWNGNPGWYGNQYVYPGFYYFGWSFHQ